MLSVQIHLCCQEKLMSIVRTHPLRTNLRDFPGITKIHVAETINITNNGTILKGQIWNDLLLDE